MLQHVAGGDRLASAHAFGRREAPAAGEHGQPLEHFSLRWRQQLITPFDRRPQRLLARQRRSAAAGEQAETMVQTGRELVDGQAADQRGCQLERQRNAVEALADPGDRRRVARREGEAALAAWPRSTNSFSAAYVVDCLGAWQRLRGSGRATTAPASSPHQSGQATRGSSPARWSPGQARSSASTRRAQPSSEVLAVVQYEQESTRLQRRHQRREQWAGRAPRAPRTRRRRACGTSASSVNCASSTSHAPSAYRLDARSRGL